LISIVACIGAGWAQAAEIRTLVSDAVKMRIRRDAIDPRRTQVTRRCH
jgi:hypothetical protein